MSGFNWACPTCGAATHSEGILVRTSERACSCDSPLWVASDMPRCVVKLQEEISALRAEKLTDASALRLALERIAALEKAIANAPHTHDCDAYIWIDGVCNCWKLEALREAGYLKEDGDE